MTEQPSHDEVAHLELDETIPPRPEEEIADLVRSDPEAGTASESAPGFTEPDTVPDR